MAKNTSKNTPAQSEELTRQQTAMATTDSDRPSYIPDTREGLEHLTRADIAMPRLAIAQAMSPQLVRSEPGYIPTLQQGHLFNTITSRIYEEGPIQFAIVRADKPRGVEFIPRESGGGVKDPNVPLTDPRMQWGPDGKQPVATLFYDYLVMLLPNAEDPNDAVPEPEMIALSFKGTSIKVAKLLNGLMTFRKGPIWAGRYTISTIQTKNSKGVFYIPVIKMDGWVPQEYAGELAKLYTEFKNKEVNIDRGDMHTADEDEM